MSTLKVALVAPTASGLPAKSEYAPVPTIISAVPFPVQPVTVTAQVVAVHGLVTAAEQPPELVPPNVIAP